MSLENVTRLDGFAAGSVGPLAITTWDGVPTLEHARAAVSTLDRVRTKEKIVLIMAVVGANTPPPDAEVRNLVGQAMTAVGDKMRAAVQVVEGQGFRAAAIRGVLIGMGLLIRAKHPEKVCQTVAEAAQFLAQHSEGRLQPTDIVRAVTELRGT